MKEKAGVMTCTPATRQGKEWVRQLLGLRSSLAAKE